MTTKRKRGPTATRRHVREKPAPAYGGQRLLLDTHVWLWWIAGDRRLGPSAAMTIERARDVHLSVVSAWEIAIKAGLGKLDWPANTSVGEQLKHDGFELLPLELAHVSALRTLPDGHNDPFDRMLVAQATVEGLAIVTADRRMLDLGAAIVRAGD